MRLTKSQVAQLSKWAQAGRLIVRPITAEKLPEWAKHEFMLARSVVTLLVEYANSGELEAKTIARNKRYGTGNRKGWETRKRQAAARAAEAKQNVGEAEAA